MDNIKVEEKKNSISEILKGIGISFIVTLVCIFLFAIILTYTQLPESTIPIVIIILTFISILIGSMISMKKVSQNGLLNGGIIGRNVCYIIVYYIQHCKF